MTRDGKRLYSASNLPGGLGSFDIYYSDRTAAGWGSPVNLGAKINTTGGDGDVVVVPDGRTLIFPSKRVDTLGESDLYNSRFENNFWLERPISARDSIQLATTVVRGSVMTERRST